MDQQESIDMAILDTPLGQQVLNDEEPYIIERLKDRYYFTAELIQDGAQEAIRIWVYDAVADTELITPQIVSAAQASEIWQSMFRKLSA
jgi:hypothetical protein